MTIVPGGGRPRRTSGVVLFILFRYKVGGLCSMPESGWLGWLTTPPESSLCAYGGSRRMLLMISAYVQSSDARTDVDKLPYSVRRTTRSCTLCAHATFIWTHWVSINSPTSKFEFCVPVGWSGRRASSYAAVAFQSRFMKHLLCSVSVEINLNYL